MKFIKWKSLIITCIVCLLPIFFGTALWNSLPESMAVHFDIYNTPDNFASKGFAVFGLPLLMVLLQILCCIINDINAHKHGSRRKLEAATKWIIPVMTIILQSITLGCNLGYEINIRKAAGLIVGSIFLIIGNYLPKFDYIKDYNIDAEKALKINRFIGFLTVVWGILMLLTVFLPPAATIVWLVSLIPYAAICIIYGIVIGRNH